MNPYVKAVRAPFLAGSVIPVVIGSTFAFEQGCFSFADFILCISGIIGLHLGANLLNDYFDAKGSDPINMRVTPFSGGSRVIQDGEVPAVTVLIMALVFFGVGLGTGAWLALVGRPLAIPIGLLGLGIGWAYSAPPLKLMNRGWGEVVIFFAFGPLITLGTFYVMSGSLNWIAFMLGAPQGFFISGVIWINQFPDFEADKKAGKRNLVVRSGPATARIFYLLIMISGFFSVIFIIGIFQFTYLIILSFAALPLAVKAMGILWKEYLSYDRLIPAQALTIQTLIVHGLFLSLGVFLSHFNL
jgi:1,4-dihydroxy-2-naphthoate octaprenyltransferase